MEPRTERRIVGAGTLLLHAVLGWCLLNTVEQGISGAGKAQPGDGDALVVAFVTLPAKGSAHAEVPALPTSDPVTAQEQPVQSEQTTPDAGSGPPHILSVQGDYAPSGASAASIPSPSQASAAASDAAMRGSPANDLAASYHAALRARIAQTWQTLSRRDFPTGCALLLRQSPGGAITATSANGCALSQDDRLQLEAATLMAQPLPYAGYESVFATELVLAL
ncbi:MAG: hypothetical protein IT472_03355 [Thermomonas sp.]|uniref:hypothetical protein n=1 Tax=Thermomonas sp. TaxID=1971895 RepID=UPI00262A7F78|nr:hypothetical protein [Thermomonas sp.]MCC7096201.1 hypothetical protein [Thermomonas sp.]